MNLSNDTFLIGGRHRTSRSWLSLIADRLQQLRAIWVRRRARAREMQDLYRCSDRELSDMGLSRSDLMAIQNGSFRRD